MNQDDDSESEEEIESWVKIERRKVERYLDLQGTRHGGVGEWPAFAVHPHLALWAVQSAAHEGKIGWWAISGDVPTDYMSSGNGQHPREALAYFSVQWKQAASAMQNNGSNAVANVIIGTPDQWPTLAPLLESRAEILQEYAEDDSLWEEEQE